MAEALIAHQKLNHPEVQGENIRNHKTAAVRRETVSDFVIAENG
jgi:hypothetical protein